MLGSKRYNNQRWHPCRKERRTETYSGIPLLGSRDGAKTRESRGVTERVRNTDIALAKLNDDVTFENRFSDIDADAKVLVPSSNIKQKDQFYINSFVTGRQFLVSAGVLGQARAGLPSKNEVNVFAST